MDDHKLTRLMRQKSAQVPSRTRFCPPDQQIANYFAGTLAGNELTSLKNHLVECRFCMARVGNLERSDNADTDVTVPGSVLADAKRMGTTPVPSRTRISPAWATAAVVVLALTVMVVRGPQPGPESASLTPDEIVTPESPRQQRSIDQGAPAPTVISPGDGDNIEPGALMVRWTEVRGSLHYDVQVVNAEGFIVWRDRVEGTSWAPPLNDQLEPGMTYYVRVDAYLAEANNVSSEHILFTVGDAEE